MIVDWERNAARQCDCVQVKRINHVLQHSKIGAEFRAKTFDNFIATNADIRIQRAFKTAKAYVEKFNEIRSAESNSIGFVGAVGVGKTHLASAVSNALLAKGIGVRYFNFVTGFKEMFARYDQGGGAVDEVRQALFAADVLFLDDVGKGKINRNTGLVELTKGVVDELYAIVNYRYDNRKPIIWTSEVYEDLLDVLDDSGATASRLFQMSRGNIADMMYRKGEDITSLNWRLKEGAK